MRKLSINCSYYRIMLKQLYRTLPIALFVLFEVFNQSFFNSFSSSHVLPHPYSTPSPPPFFLSSPPPFFLSQPPPHSLTPTLSHQPSHTHPLSHTNLFPSPCSEPGYYEANSFGIRIENLMIVVPLPEMGEFAGRGQ